MMNIKPERKKYKIKCEIYVTPDKNGEMGEARFLYVCDPEKNTACKKTGCGTYCTRTRELEFAKHFRIGEEDGE